jgi:hypothetical protein
VACVARSSRAGGRDLRLIATDCARGAHKDSIHTLATLWRRPRESVGQHAHLLDELGRLENLEVDADHHDVGKPAEPLVNASKVTFSGKSLHE